MTGSLPSLSAEPLSLVNRSCLIQTMVGIAKIAAITALAVGVISLLAQYDVIPSSYDLVGKGVSWGMFGGAVVLLVGLVWLENHMPSSSAHAAPASPSVASPFRAPSLQPAALAVFPPKPPASASAQGTAPTGALAAFSEVDAAVSRIRMDLYRPYSFFADAKDPRRITRSQLEDSFPNGLPVGIGTLEKPFRLGSLVFGQEVNANWGEPTPAGPAHAHDFYVEVSQGIYEWRIPPGYDYNNLRAIMNAIISAVPSNAQTAVASPPPILENLAKTFFDSLGVIPYPTGQNRVTRTMLARFAGHSLFGVGTKDNPLRFGAYVFGHKISVNWGKSPRDEDLEHPHTFYIEIIEGQFDWRLPPGYDYAPILPSSVSPSDASVVANGTSVAASEAGAAVPLYLSQPYLFFADFNDLRRITRGQLEHSFPHGLPTGLGTRENPFRLGSVVFGKEINADWGDLPLEEEMEHLHNFYVEVSQGIYEWRFPPGCDYRDRRAIMDAAIARNQATKTLLSTSQNYIKTFFYSVGADPYLPGENRITRALLSDLSLHSTFGAGTVENPLRFGARVFGYKINASWGKLPQQSQLEHPHFFYIEVTKGQYEWRAPPGYDYAPEPTLLSAFLSLFE